jgi:hypothetical protein
MKKCGRKFKKERSGLQMKSVWKFRPENLGEELL